MIHAFNMIWPAIYVYDELWKFWYLVVLTVAIEAVILNRVLKSPLSKAFLASLTGHLVSGLIGPFVMMWAMLFLWHGIADRFVSHGTFDLVNWIATFVLMCVGSVALEFIVVKRFFPEKTRGLFLTVLSGNLLTYIIIVFSMTAGHSTEEEKNYTTYEPSEHSFLLLDSTSFRIDSAKILSSDAASSLHIWFTKEIPQSFTFEFRLSGAKYAGGIEEGHKSIQLPAVKDTLRVVLEEKNPDPGVGWTSPVITDTITFVPAIVVRR